MLLVSHFALSGLSFLDSMKKKIRIYSQYYTGWNNALTGRIYDYINALHKEYDIEIISSFDIYPKNILKRFYRKKLQQKNVSTIEIFSGKNTSIWVLHRLLHYIIFSLSSFFHICFSSKPQSIIILSPPIFLPIFCMYAARIRKIWYILEVHDLWPESIVQFWLLKRESFLFSLLKKYEQKIYASAKHIIALTSWVWEGIVSLIPDQSQKISLLYFIAQKIENTWENPYPKLGVDIWKREIYLFAGNMNEAYDFIQATDFIPSQQDLFFVFIWDGSQKEFIQKNIAHNENVLMLPRMSKQEVEKYIYYCDGIFIPLKDDTFYKGTFPVKWIEAIVNDKEIIFWWPEDGEFALFLKRLENNEVSKEIFGKQYFVKELSTILK